MHLRVLAYGSNAPIMIQASYGRFPISRRTRHINQSNAFVIIGARP